MVFLCVFLIRKNDSIASSWLLAHLLPVSHLLGDICKYGLQKYGPFFVYL